MKTSWLSRMIAGACCVAGALHALADTNLTAGFTFQRTNAFARVEERTGLRPGRVEVSLRNDWPFMVSASARVVVAMSPALGTVTNADGTWAGPDNTWNPARPYFRMGGLAGEGGLAAGATAPLHLALERPASVRLGFSMEIYERDAASSNSPPVFTSVPVTNAMDGYVYYYEATATDPDGDPLVFELIGCPTGMTVFATNGVVRWTPSRNQAGVNPVALRVMDPFGGSARQDYTVDVAWYNEPPVITSKPRRNGQVGESYQYPVVAYDPEGGAIAYALDAGPAGMNLDAQSGQLAWTPAAGQTGVVSVAVSAADLEGAMATQRYEVVVLDPAFTLAMLAPLGGTTIVAGTTLRLDAAANHPRAAIGAEPLPDYALFFTNRFTFTPSNTQAGVYRLVFTARLGGQHAQSFYDLEVLRTNIAPVIVPPGDHTLAEGERLSFAIEATDGDGDALAYTAPGLALQNAWFDVPQRQFSFQPVQGQAGIYTVGFAVSDGIATSTATAHITVTAAPVTNEQFELVVDGVESPTLKETIRVSGNVKGRPGAPAPLSPPMLITSVAPDSGRQGVSGIEVALRGLNTAFARETTTVDFGAGITVLETVVASPSNLTARIAIAPEAALGTRVVNVDFGSQRAYSVVAFNVEEGLSRICGQIIDSFTTQAVAGATVQVYGSRVQSVTGPDGRFCLEDKVAGASELLITAPNFEALRVAFALGKNETLDLDAPLEMKAIARAIDPGGGLPAEATLPSILDRGVALDQCFLSLEQAEILVQDALLALGGTEVGVLDAGGNQLNPQVVGSGMMSLTPQGVAQHAQALVEGGVYTLADFFQMLRAGFTWENEPPSDETLLARFQESVNEAWQNPNAPSSAMPIALFNKGRALSFAPPLLSRETRLNRFQCFLLFSSFLIANANTLDQTLTASLEERGIDYTSYLPDGHPLKEKRDRRMESLLRQIEPPARKSGGVTIAEPNIYDINKRYAGEQYSAVWKKVMGDGIVCAAYAALGNAVVTMGIQMGIGMALGSGVGGVTGALGGMMIAASASIQGFVETLITKLVTAWFLGHVVATFQPWPPLPVGSDMDDQTNLVITFERSQSELDRNLGAPTVVRANKFSQMMGYPTKRPDFNYVYLLYAFANASETSGATNVPARLRVDLSDTRNFDTNYPHGRLQFIVPNAFLKEGVNYYRILTIQFVRNCETPLVEGLEDYDFDGDGFIAWPAEWSGTKADFDALDANHDGKLTTEEFGDRHPHVFSAVPEDVKNMLGEGNPNISSLLPVSRVPLTKKQYQGLVDDYQEILDQKANDFKRNSEKQLLGELEDTQAVTKKTATDLRIEIETSSKNFYFTQGNGQKLLQSADALQYLQTEKNPSAPDFDEVAKRLGMKPEDIDDDLRKSMSSFAESTQIVGIEKQRVVMAGDNMKYLDGLAGTVADTPPDQKVSGLMRTMDKNGVTRFTGFEITGGDTRALNDLRIGQLADFDDARINLEYNNRMVDISQNYVHERLVPGLDNYKMSQSTRSTKLQTANQNISELEIQKVRAQDRLDKVGKGSPANTQEFVEDAWQKTKKANLFEEARGGVMDAMGGLITGTEIMAMFANTLRVLHSEFSPCHIFTYTKGAVVSGYPPGIEPFAGWDDPGAILFEHRVPTNDKMGYITAAYPLENFPFKKYECGFPPGGLAVDGRGRAYAINMNSTINYGGRLFRFTPVRRQPASFSREYVGNINYFSLSIFFGRPANPVAMCCGPEFPAADYAGRTLSVQDLFVADIDFVNNRRQILRVPVSQLELRADVYATGDRSHICGQPVLHHDAFQFTGPSDMEVGPDPAFVDAWGTADSPLFLSDEQSIYVLKRVLGTDNYTLQELLNISGARWSGLAFDRIGGFYFADFAAGAIYGMPWKSLRGALLDGRTIRGWTELMNETNRAFAVTRGLTAPGDIEVEGPSDIYQRALLVSTPRGIERVPMPIVIRKKNSATATGTAIGVVRGTMVTAGQSDPVNPLIVTIGTMFDELIGRQARLYVDRLTAALQLKTQQYDCVPAKCGATIIDDFE